MNRSRFALVLLLAGLGLTVPNEEERDRNLQQTFGYLSAAGILVVGGPNFGLCGDLPQPCPYTKNLLIGFNASLTGAKSRAYYDAPAGSDVAPTVDFVFLKDVVRRSD